MNQELIITRETIDVAALEHATSAPDTIGAVVSFIGLVRGIEGDARIVAMEYECFEKMARHQCGLIFEKASARWPVESVRVVHRIGFVKVGEPYLWIQVTAAHRLGAFSACQWIMDEMKRVVPIWKKPAYAPK
jgi:molybdopterin synthase catalytic subunit